MHRRATERDNSMDYRVDDLYKVSRVFHPLSPGWLPCEAKCIFIGTYEECQQFVQDRIYVADLKDVEIRKAEDHGSKKNVGSTSG